LKYLLLHKYPELLEQTNNIKVVKDLFNPFRVDEILIIFWLPMFIPSGFKK